jgi:hypothetical protein
VALYRGDKPEYYFLFLIPAILQISVTLIPKLGRTASVFLLLLFVSYSVCIAIISHNSQNNITIGVVSNIVTTVQDISIKQFVYDIKLGDDYAVKYFLTSTPLSSEGVVFHITYPNNYDFARKIQKSAVGVWIDPRVEPNHNYVTTNQYILETGGAYRLLADLDPKLDNQMSRYSVVQNDSGLGIASKITLSQGFPRFKVFIVQSV